MLSISLILFKNIFWRKYKSISIWIWDPETQPPLLFVLGTVGNVRGLSQIVKIYNKIRKKRDGENNEKKKNTYYYRWRERRTIMRNPEEWKIKRENIFGRVLT